LRRHAFEAQRQAHRALAANDLCSPCGMKTYTTSMTHVVSTKNSDTDSVGGLDKNGQEDACLFTPEQLPAAGEPIFFTIGLPCFKRPETTKLAIASCLAQTHPHFQVVVSDDTPDASIQAVVETFASSKIRYIKNDPPLGPPAKYNDMFDRVAKGWMVMLGDDDQLEPRFLERVAQAIREQASLVLIHTRSRMFDTEGRFLAEDRVPDACLEPADAIPHFYRYWFQLRVSLTGFVFPVELMRRIGGFRPLQMHYFEDTLAWTEIASYGQTCLIAEPLLRLRETRSSMGHTALDAISRDVPELLASRSLVTDVICRCFDRLRPSGGESGSAAHIDRAKRQCLRFVASDSRVFLLAALRRPILACVPDRQARVARLIQAIQAAPVPGLMTSRFRLLLAGFRHMSRWPAPLGVRAVRLEQLASRSFRFLQRGCRRSTPLS
jgi:Glycosyl transferase family 2